MGWGSDGWTSVSIVVHIFTCAGHSQRKHKHCYLLSLILRTKCQVFTFDINLQTLNATTVCSSMIYSVVVSHPMCRVCLLNPHQYWNDPMKRHLKKTPLSVIFFYSSKLLQHMKYLLCIGV